MNWIEDRIRGLERRIEDLLRLVQDTILPQLRGTQQGIQGTYQQPVQTTTSGGGMYYCAPGGSIAAASGTPAAAGTPGSGNAAIYALTGGVYSVHAASATVYNPMLSATTAGRVLAVADNGDGTYTAIAQSCN
jgi:hypothetical protein